MINVRCGRVNGKLCAGNSLLLSKIIKVAAMLNVSIRRTNCYKKYIRYPSLALRRYLVFIPELFRTKASDWVSASSLSGPKEKRFLVKISFSERDRTRDRCMQCSESASPSQRCFLNKLLNELLLATKTAFRFRVSVKVE